MINITNRIKEIKNNNIYPSDSNFTLLIFYVLIPRSLVLLEFSVPNSNKPSLASAAHPWFTLCSLRRKEPKPWGARMFKKWTSGKRKKDGDRQPFLARSSSGTLPTPADQQQLSLSYLFLEALRSPYRASRHFKSRCRASGLQDFRTLMRSSQARVLPFLPIPQTIQRSDLGLSSKQSSVRAL